MADRAKDQNNTIHNNNTGVFTTHTNKNTRMMLVTPAGKVTERRDSTENVHKKKKSLQTQSMCGHPVVRATGRQIRTPALGFALPDLHLQGGSCFRDKPLSCVLMSLSICIVQGRPAAAKAAFSPFAGLTQ